MSCDWHKLILVDCDQRDRCADFRGVNLVQVDRFRQTHERLGDMGRGVRVAARQQVRLDGEVKATVDAHGRRREACGEFFGTAVGRHGQRARQPQPFRSVAVIHCIAHDRPLNAAPGGGHGMRTIGRTDRDDAPHQRRPALGECKRDHTPVRSSDDRGDVADAQMCNDAAQGVGLVIGAD